MSKTKPKWLKKKKSVRQIPSKQSSKIFIEKSSNGVVKKIKNEKENSNG
jgi:hypothetical protein